MTDPTAFDNADFIADGHSYFDRWSNAAGGFRAGLPDRQQRLDLPYGDGPRAFFDLFLPEGEAAGLVIFLHGGFWRMFGRKDWSHLAVGALDNGWAMAIPSYPLAPAARLAEITRAVAQALPAMAAEVAGPILIAGHSAGGHLAMRMVCLDVEIPAEVRARIAGILAISPLADLNPLLMLPMNEFLRIDAEEADAESPINCPPPDCKVQIEVGSLERPAFIDQAVRMADEWLKAELVIEKGLHHFDVIEPLADPQSRMMRDLLAMAADG